MPKEVKEQPKVNLTDEQNKALQEMAKKFHLQNERDNNPEFQIEVGMTIGVHRTDHDPVCPAIVLGVGKNGKVNAIVFSEFTGFQVEKGLTPLQDKIEPGSYMRTPKMLKERLAELRKEARDKVQEKLNA